MTQEQLPRFRSSRHAASRNHCSVSQKLLVVQPLMADGRSCDGDPVVAVDGVGAGVGERVVLTSDGRGARELLRARATPVRWTIVAIEDPKAA